MPFFPPRPVTTSEIPQLAKVWHNSWHTAHAALVPEDLTALRTIDSFQTHLTTHLAATRTLGPTGRPLGLCQIKHDELSQLYIANIALGSGAAKQLIADAEQRLVKNGTKTAFLTCVAQNHRAVAFYQKCGWHITDETTANLETSQGPYPLPVLRLEKAL